MIFLLIGPSGIGKSTAANILKSNTNISVFDLDSEIKGFTGVPSLSRFLVEIGNKEFFQISQTVIDEIAASLGHSFGLIDVGAGSINYDLAIDWYANQNMIALTGDPLSIYNRSNRQKFHPDFSCYINSEFSKKRLVLYAAAKKIIIVDHHSPEEVAVSIIQFIKSYE